MIYIAVNETLRPMTIYFPLKGILLYYTHFNQNCWKPGLTANMAMIHCWYCCGFSMIGPLYATIPSANIANEDQALWYRSTLPTYSRLDFPQESDQPSLTSQATSALFQRRTASSLDGCPTRDSSRLESWNIDVCHLIHPIIRNTRRRISVLRMDHTFVSLSPFLRKS